MRVGMRLAVSAMAALGVLALAGTVARAQTITAQSVIYYGSNAYSSPSRPPAYTSAYDPPLRGYTDSSSRSSLYPNTSADPLGPAYRDYFSRHNPRKYYYRRSVRVSGGF